MGYDGKYGQVDTAYGDIGEDEPVIVFRAQDPLLVPTLGCYYALCAAAGSPQRHLDIINHSMERFRKWQANPANHVKPVPKSDGPAGKTYFERNTP